MLTFSVTLARLDSLGASSSPGSSWWSQPLRRSSSPIGHTRRSESQDSRIPFSCLVLLCNSREAGSSSARRSTAAGISTHWPHTAPGGFCYVRMGGWSVGGQHSDSLPDHLMEIQKYFLAYGTLSATRSLNFLLFNLTRADCQEDGAEKWNWKHPNFNVQRELAEQPKQ